jgi:hypothetical protein
MSDAFVGLLFHHKKMYGPIYKILLPQQAKQTNIYKNNNEWRICWSFTHHLLFAFVLNLREISFFICNNHKQKLQVAYMLNKHNHKTPHHVNK